MTIQKNLTVGVLALQGSFREHISHLRNLFIQLSKDPQYSQYNLSVIPVRKLEDLPLINGLILVGGESTTISILLQRTGLYEPLSELIQSGKIAIWGTCAGLILISKLVTNTKAKLGDVEYKLLGGLDVSIERNSFGRQLDSFTQKLYGFEGLDEDGGFDGVFIRAPVITGILESSKVPVYGSLEPSTNTKEGIVVAPEVAKNDANINILSTVRREDRDLIVAVRQGHILGTSFHPELVQNDYRFHKWFLDQFVIKAYITQQA